MTGGPALARLAAMLVLAASLALPAAPAMAAHDAPMDMASAMMSAPDAEACHEAETPAATDMQDCCGEDCDGCVCAACFSALSGLVLASPPMISPAARHLRRMAADTVPVRPGGPPDSPPKHHS